MVRSIEDFERKVLGVFERAPGAHRPRPERKFNTDDEFLSYGLPVPVQRRIWKQLLPELAPLTLARRVGLAQRLIGAHVGELGHAGIFVLACSAGELTPRHFRKIDKMIDDFRGWSHVDHFCGDVMQPVLARHPREVVELCRRWSRSPNRWKRRSSVVTFTRKVGESGEFTDEVLRLCDDLVRDEEDLVRKAVGWALKDNLRSAPDRIIPYVKQLRRNGISSTITLYAIRDLRGARRREVLAVTPASRG